VGRRRAPAGRRPSLTSPTAPAPAQAINGLGIAAQQGAAGATAVISDAALAPLRAAAQSARAYQAAILNEARRGG
jgi:hypothetical protein